MSQDGPQEARLCAARPEGWASGGLRQWLQSGFSIPSNPVLQMVPILGLWQGEGRKHSLELHLDVEAV